MNLGEIGTNRTERDKKILEEHRYKGYYILIDPDAIGLFPSSGIRIHSQILLLKVLLPDQKPIINVGYQTTGSSIIDIIHVWKFVVLE